MYSFFYSHCYISLSLLQRKNVCFYYRHRYIASSLLRRKNVLFYCVRHFPTLIFATKNIRSCCIYSYFALSWRQRKHTLLSNSSLFYFIFATKKEFSLLVYTTFFALYLLQRMHVFIVCIVILPYLSYKMIMYTFIIVVVIYYSRALSLLQRKITVLLNVSLFCLIFAIEK